MPLFGMRRSWTSQNGKQYGLPHLSNRTQNQVRSGVLTLLLGATMGVVVSSRVTATPSDNSEKSSAVILRRIQLTADGDKKEFLTEARTVEELFTENRIILGEHDRCSAKMTARLKDGMSIAVTRIRVETTTERTPIAFAIRRKYSPELTVGTHVVKQEGKAGEKAVIYRDYYKEGTRTERILVGRNVTPPQTQVEVHGVRGMTLASRHLFAGRRVITMRASAYGPSGWGGRTATGSRVGVGVVAVDPRFIPLGTRLYIEGYGFAVAGDTGGAIKGDRIDLGMDSEGQAWHYGRRTVKVMILD